MQISEALVSKEKAVFFWSGGKDSALALYYCFQQAEYEVKYLLTTINAEYHRISMHGVKEVLLEAQASAIGIPLLKMEVREGTNAEYECVMQTVLAELKEKEGITACIFGDIFLEDLRAYRERQLERAGYKGVFPLWKKDTSKLIREFLDLRFRTITCCTYDKFLGPAWCGRIIDEKFLNELPPGVDPCGENGEFHTFCFDGPLFKNKLELRTGEKLYKPIDIKSAHASEAGGFWFCDLELPRRI